MIYYREQNPNLSDFDYMGYTKEEIEEMSPLVTCIEVQKKIAKKQNELLGKIDLVALKSKLGSGSSSSGSSAETEGGETVKEAEPEVNIYTFMHKYYYEYFISRDIINAILGFRKRLVRQ